MRCPTCQTSVADDTIFCPECGTRIAASGPVPSVPTRVLQDRYVLAQKLGQGGMGAVYRASDRRLSTVVWAVKELSDGELPTQAEREQARQLFRHEAELLAGLSHSNLPRVTDHFEQDGRHYLVMELVPGETLLAFLNRTGLPQPPERVYEWAAQLAAVLEYLHNRQPPIIFRDLKPANIMLTPDGTLKLIDFGIARLFKPGQAKDTQAFGTVGYSAPEQYGRGQTDARSDIYSLGVLIHQLLTGYDPTKTPFRLPLANQLNLAIGPAVASVLARASDGDPQRRFGSVPEFRDALLGAAGVARPATGQGPAVPHPPPYAGLSQPVAGSTLLAQSALWCGIAGMVFTLLSLGGMIAAQAIGANNGSGWSVLGVLSGIFGLLLVALTAILGLIALLSKETQATLAGRRHAIIGLALSGFGLLACCISMSLTPPSA